MPDFWIAERKDALTREGRLRVLDGADDFTHWQHGFGCTVSDSGGSAGASFQMICEQSERQTVRLDWRSGRAGMNGRTFATAQVQRIARTPAFSKLFYRCRFNGFAPFIHDSVNGWHTSAGSREQQHKQHQQQAGQRNGAA